MSFLARALALTASTFGTAPSTADEASFARSREAMVAEQIAAREVRDQKTLAALRKVPRHLFVPARGPAGRLRR